MYTFTEATATEILEKLKAKGYTIDPGLSDAEVVAVEQVFKAPLPPDFKIFLQTGVIKSSPPFKDSKGVIRQKPYFPDWRNPAEVAAEAWSWVERAFSFDIKNNVYWYKQFGEKPKDQEKAVEQAFAVIRTWPPLFPIHGHRFIPSNPHKSGNPVLSVWQAIDTIYYGMNLLEHMNMEFGLDIDVAHEGKKPVPFWGEAFDLDMVWQPLHPNE